MGRGGGSGTGAKVFCSCAVAGRWLAKHQLVAGAGAGGRAFDVWE